MTKVRLCGQLRYAKGICVIKVCETTLARRSVETGQALHSLAAETDDARRARRLFKDESWGCSTLKDSAVPTNVVQCEESTFDLDFF